MANETQITINIARGIRQTTSGLQEAVEDNLAHADKSNRQIEVAQTNLLAFSDLIEYVKKYHLIGTNEVDALSGNYEMLKTKYLAKRNA